jgi:hypothetical protein
MASDVEKGMKHFPGLRMKLNYFQRQLEASKTWNTEEDRLPIRAEWTTVDRILDTRCSLLWTPHILILLRYQAFQVPDAYG